MIVSRNKLLFMFVMFKISSVMSQEPKRSLYTGFTLIRITPVSRPQLEYVQQLLANTSLGLDVWITTTTVNKSADVLVPPQLKEAMLKEFQDINIPHDLLIYNVGSVIDEELKLPAVLPKSPISFFSQYNNVSNIYKFLSELSEGHRNIASTMVIGRSTEGRPLRVVKVSTSERANKPVIWIQSGIHAREHIAPAVVTYIASELVENFENSDVQRIVEAFDWYIMPVVNVDGYEYSHTVDRLWRKTRSYNPSNPECIGVDANRNWNFHWNEGRGSSGNPCSNTFAGTAPFSEPEIRAVSNQLLRLKDRLLLFLDIHSYGQFWLTPWGYTRNLPSTYMEIKGLADIAVEALSRIRGTRYKVGSSARTLYLVSGGARDWAYGVAGATYSYTVELPDTGDFGFLLPKDQIVPTAEETWIGIKAMALHLRRELEIEKQTRIRFPVE